VVIPSCTVQALGKAPLNLMIRRYSPSGREPSLTLTTDRWVVPLLWGPLLAAGVATTMWAPWAASNAGGLSAAVAQMAGGVMLWELTEYSLHRWVCTNDSTLHHMHSSVTVHMLSMSSCSCGFADYSIAFRLCRAGPAAPHAARVAQHNLQFKYRL
jgi:hypothetical protein